MMVNNYLVEIFKKICYNNYRKLKIRRKYMSKKEKLLKRLKLKPSDFIYDELRTLLNYLGFVLCFH